MRGRLYLGQVAECVSRSEVSCRPEGPVKPTERVGGREWDEILRFAQDDRRGKRVRCEWRALVGRGLKLEMVIRKKQIPRCARNDNSRGFRRAGGWVGLLGHAGWPARNRAPLAAQGEQARPVVHAERIRRSWGAVECAAMGPVVEVGLVDGRAKS